MLASGTTRRSGTSSRAGASRWPPGLSELGGIDRHLGGNRHMSTEPLAPRTRRALLAAAAGAGAALAASAAAPAAMLAADPNDVVKGVDNATTATTSVTNSGGDSTAFAGHATGTGTGYGVLGTSSGGAGVVGFSITTPDWDPPFDPSIVTYTGVFGFAPPGDQATTFGAGVWGDSQNIGVYGSGGTGVYGYGGIGVVGEANSLANSVGVLGYAPSTSQWALVANGKVSFSRSGRKAVSSGKANVVVNLSGVKSSSLVFAVLATSESGRWVRAVVPASGKFTVYFNTSLNSSASVSWFVLD
jgi:hypothetical protein